MLIQVITDNHITGSESLIRHVEDVVGGTLDRFGERVTRVEVHLRDDNGPKGGPDDHQCSIEARLAGLKPVGVSEKGTTLDQALTGAAEKLEKLLENHLGRIEDRRGRGSAAGEQPVV